MSKTWKREPGSSSEWNRRGSQQSAWRHLYASHRWRVASENFRKTPHGCLCVDCKAEGRVTPSEHVDHIIPHEGDLVKFWDQSNWAGRCASHHASKGHDDRFR
jgi:5-methylcytosine-specific restriction protein A